MENQTESLIEVIESLKKLIVEAENKEKQIKKLKQG